jgi:TatD DNase family protein
MAPRGSGEFCFQYRQSGKLFLGVRLLPWEGRTLPGPGILTEIFLGPERIDDVIFFFLRKSPPLSGIFGIFAYMIQLIDTHCHLYGRDFTSDIEDVMQRAEKEGVEKFYLPSIDSESLDALLGLEERYPGKCIGMIGLHPCSVKADYASELKLVEEWLGRRPWVAVGEIGLDFYWDRTFEKEQYDAFHRQVQWALQYDVPIVIHCRDSMAESIKLVGEHQKGKLRGIFHCFGGDVESARQIIDLGFYLGIGGVLTYKNSGLPATLKEIELEHLVLETDAPYLSPVPFRGKRNESSYLKYVAAKLAEVKGVSVEEVARITTQNAQKIFGM